MELFSQLKLLLVFVRSFIVLLHFHCHSEHSEKPAYPRNVDPPMVIMSHEKHCLGLLQILISYCCG